MVSKKCEGRECNNEVTNGIAILESKENWGKVLCMDCQIKANELAHDSKAVEEKEVEVLPAEDETPLQPEEETMGIPERNMPATVEHRARAIQQADSDLTNDNVRKYICPTATDNELFMFLKLCEARNLNPFIKEAYLVKYNNSPATLIVGKDAFTKKAEDHPAFDGFEAGIIIKTDNGLVYREGQFVDKGEHLVGGWASVARSDRKIPFRSEVSMTEYNTGKSSWAKIPATMIRKVALVQALREAFPSDLGGCYDSAEMDQARK